MKNASRCRLFAWVGLVAVLAASATAEVIQVDLNLIAPSAETNQWGVRMTEHITEGGQSDEVTADSSGTITVDLDLTFDSGTQAATLDTVSFPADEPGQIQWNDLGYFIGALTFVDVWDARATLSSPGGAITPVAGAFPSEDVPFTLNAGMLDVFEGPVRDFTVSPLTGVTAGQTGSISVGAPVVSGINLTYAVAVAVPVSFAVDSVVSNASYDVDMTVGSDGPPVTVLAATGQIVRSTLEVNNDAGASGVTQTSATLNGELVETFGEATTVLIYWGTTDGGATPGAWGQPPVDLGVSAEGPLSTSLIGLALDTTYYYRFYAVNANGEAWAPATASFTTDADFSQFAHQLAITFTGYTRAETLTNFPALVMLDEQDVPCFGYSLMTHPSNGADLRFSDATGQSLNYEVETWDPAGTSAIWVQVPALSAGTTITAHWANASASATPPAYTTDGSSWSEGYEGVWHLNETSGDASDATGYGRDGVPMGGVTQGVSGVVGKGLEFDDDGGADLQHVDLTAHLAAFSAIDQGSLQVFFKTPGGANVDTFLAMSDSADGSSEVRFITEFNTVIYDMRDSSGSPFGEGGTLQSGGPVLTDTWRSTAVSVHATNSAALYLDGALAASGDEPFFADLATPDTMAFGRNVDSAGPQWQYDGLLDEVRISSVMRSSNWVWAVHQTVLQPDTFLTFGPVSGVDTPTVHNAEATDINPLWADVNGLLSCEGVGTTEVRVYWGTSDGGTNPGAWNGASSPIDLGVSALGPVSATLSNLQELTTYFYRFYATNPAGDSWASETASFTTLSGLPLVDNAGGASDQTTTSATLNGTLSDFGIPAQVTLYWGTTDGGTSPGAWDGTPVSFGTTPSGPLATDIMGLTENTEYFYRYFASNVNGSNWAPSSESFKTSTDFGAWPRSQDITFPGYRRDAVDDIPLLVRFSEALPTFRYADFAYANGADLRFSDANGVLLPYEVEVWDPAGESAVWVLVPRLEGATTSITAYWGNAGTGAIPPAYTTDGSTWADAGYLAVWHFNETTGTVVDATGNGLDGTPVDDVVQGVDGLAGRAVFMNDDAADDGAHIDLNAHIGTIATLEEGTLMSLFRTPGAGVDTMFSLSDSADGSSEVRFIVEGSDLIYDVRDQDAALPSEGGNLRSVNVVADSDWHVGAAVIATDDNGVLYVDGSVEATGTEPFLADLQTPDTMAFGRNVDAGGPQWGFDGELDEFRISTSLRSSNWNWAVAQNLVDHEAFNSYGLVDGAVLPAVTTEEPTSVTVDSATANGELVSAGATPATVFVYYGTTDGGTNAGTWNGASSPISLGVQTAGPVSTTLTGLDEDTQYFYRFFASNAGGGVWAYSSATFVTPPLPLNEADFAKTLEICFGDYTGGELLIHFPVLVVLNEGLTGFSYADFASPTGGDLRFTSANGTTIIPHEIESWNPAGDSHVWVQVPVLSSNICIHAYWGNAGDTDVPFYATNGSTWDETYNAVWHLNEAAVDGATNAAHHADATGNGRDATQVGNASTTGRIAGGQDLDGVNDAIHANGRVLADDYENFSVSMWFNSTDADNGVLYWEQQVNGAGFWSRVEPTSLRIRGLYAPPNTIVATTNAYADGNWHLIYFVGKNGDTLQVYVDGVLQGEASGTLQVGTSDIGRIGERPNGADRLLGQVDEVRVAGAARSADWVLAAYLNQDPASSIATYGTVTDVAGLPDEDGDGIPDSWETLYFGCATCAVASADSDLPPDGATNYEEYIADTDPTNAASVFVIVDINSGSPVTVVFDSSTERVYTLEYVEDLPGASWNPVPGQEDVTGTGLGASLVDTNDTPIHRSYRLEVDLP